MKKVKVKKEAMFRDGGTTVYVDEQGNRYFADYRIGTPSTYRGLIYDKYPRDGDAKLLDVILDIEK